MITVYALHPRVEDLIGLIPDFLDSNDPRPAREQFNERYAHGGGWSPMSGWEVYPDLKIKYEGDEALPPIAVMELPITAERIIIYPHAWVMIVQADGSHEISRMD